jgi:hypothetical protein
VARLSDERSNLCKMHSFGRKAKYLSGSSVSHFSCLELRCSRATLPSRGTTVEQGLAAKIDVTRSENVSAPAEDWSIRPRSAAFRTVMYVMGKE